jgi:hypothetical protein
MVVCTEFCARERENSVISQAETEKRVHFGAAPPLNFENRLAAWLVDPSGINNEHGLVLPGLRRTVHAKV